MCANATGWALPAVVAVSADAAVSAAAAWAALSALVADVAVSAEVALSAELAWSTERPGAAFLISFLEIFLTVDLVILLICLSEFANANEPPPIAAIRAMDEITRAGDGSLRILVSTSFLLRVNGKKREGRPEPPSRRFVSDPLAPELRVRWN